MYVATNGNTNGATDPNFIHFPDEQTGLLLPNIPGYPSWLPNLQLTPTSKLTFWNFPSVYPKALVSNPANIGTPNYLINGKIITSANPNPPVPADLGVNGSTNQYFWDSCVIRQVITPQLYAVWKPILQIAINVGDTTYLHPADYIMMNIQYYMNRYLTKPFLLFDPNGGVSNDKFPWPLKFMQMQAAGTLQKFLANCNFLVNLGAGTDFVSSVDTYAPIVGAEILALASAGAGTPALTAALGAMTSAVAKNTASQNLQNLQTSITTANTAQVKADALALTGTTTTKTTEIIFIVVAVIIIILLLIFYKGKK